MASVSPAARYNGRPYAAAGVIAGGGRAAREGDLDIEAEASRVQAFVDRGNYHAAYNIALSGLNACRRENDQAGVDYFIEIIRAIVERLASEYGSPPAD